MAWTSSLPTSEGSYWMRLGDNGSPIIVNVVSVNWVGQATVRAGLVIKEIVGLTGQEQWEGPIQPPQ